MAYFTHIYGQRIVIIQFPALISYLLAFIFQQEDLLDLITALLKFNCFLSTTVAT